MLKLVSEIHTRQGAVIFSHAFRAQLYLRPTRYRFPPRKYSAQAWNFNIWIKRETIDFVTIW